MSDKEILEKAIQKAIDGGWSFSRVDMLDVPKELAEWALNSPEHLSILLSNDAFAKALWGDTSMSVDQRITELLKKKIGEI